MPLLVVPGTSANAVAQPDLPTTEPVGTQPGATRIAGFSVISTSNPDGSDSKVIAGLPVIAAPENSWGEAQVAGKMIYSVAAKHGPMFAIDGTNHLTKPFANDAGLMKIQRDPSWIWDSPHSQYESN